jgi:hypothetical protein
LTPKLVDVVDCHVVKEPVSVEGKMCSFGRVAIMERNENVLEL